jgi:hypothetical protein
MTSERGILPHGVEYSIHPFRDSKEKRALEVPAEKDLILSSYQCTLVHTPSHLPP